MIEGSCPFSMSAAAMYFEPEGLDAEEGAEPETLVPGVGTDEQDVHGSSEIGRGAVGVIAARSSRSAPPPRSSRMKRLSVRLRR